MVVKAPSWGQAGRWDGRHRGALGDSLLDALVPSAVAAAGVADDASRGTDFGWDLIALGDDRSALGGGDRAAVDIAHLVGVSLRRQATIRVHSTVAMVHSAEVWWRPVWHMSRW
jgi:hypothetical protein